MIGKVPPTIHSVDYEILFYKETPPVRANSGNVIITPVWEGDERAITVRPLSETATLNNERVDRDGRKPMMSVLDHGSTADL